MFEKGPGNPAHDVKTIRAARERTAGSTFKTVFGNLLFGLIFIPFIFFTDTLSSHLTVMIYKENEEILERGLFAYSLMFR
jgi:hypothetical protein